MPAQWRFASLSKSNRNFLNSLVEGIMTDVVKLGLIQKCKHIPVVITKQIYPDNFIICFSPNSYEILAGIDNRFYTIITTTMMEQPDFDEYELLFGSDLEFQALLH